MIANLFSDDELIKTLIISELVWAPEPFWSLIVGSMYSLLVIVTGRRVYYVEGASW